jgi:hypothetical protein
LRKPVHMIVAMRLTSNNVLRRLEGSFKTQTSNSRGAPISNSQ